MRATGADIRSAARSLSPTTTGRCTVACVVIPAERRQAREPGPRYPCSGHFMMPGYLVPGSAAHRLPPGSRCARPGLRCAAPGMTAEVLAKHMGKLCLRRRDVERVALPARIERKNQGGA